MAFRTLARNRKAMRSIERAPIRRPRVRASLWVDKDGAPFKWSFFTGLTRFVLWGFVLICGGFFA